MDIPLLGRTRSLRIGLACKYGVDGALFLRSMEFWIEKNIANRKHCYDGRFWTYNSTKAFAEMFPFWSERQVRRIVDTLIKSGAIVKANYNPTKYDRTTWYAFSDELFKSLFPDKTVTCIRPNGQMDSTEQSNGFTENVEPIPDKDTVKDTDKGVEYISIAKKLKSKIEEHRPSAKISKGQVSKWCKEIGLMIRRDNRTVAEIEQVIEWIFSDASKGSNGFWWADNIGSAAKLRLRWNEGKLDKAFRDDEDGVVYMRETDNSWMKEVGFDPQRPRPSASKRNGHGKSGISECDDFLPGA